MELRNRRRRTGLGGRPAFLGAVAAALAIWIVAAPASAGDLVVTVRTPQGAPIADAVVSIAASASGPIHFPWPYRMAQQNIMFHPFVLIVPVGADVDFPNLDQVRHHVYSFSPAKTFELKLYGHDETRVVHFDKPGVVQLGCNIHDSMIAFIDVVTTPYVAKTGADGVARIAGAPAGAQPVRIWRPFLKAPGATLTQTVQIPAAGEARLAITADLRPPPDHMGMY
jgi:plastocyanin